MKQVFEAYEFDDQNLACSRCGWQGKGSETHLIDFYGITDYREAHCPQCDTSLARVKREDLDTGESPGETSFQIG